MGIVPATGASAADRRRVSGRRCVVRRSSTSPEVATVSRPRYRVSTFSPYRPAQLGGILAPVVGDVPLLLCAGPRKARSRACNADPLSLPRRLDRGCPPNAMAVGTVGRSRGRTAPAPGRSHREGDGVWGEASAVPPARAFANAVLPLILSGRIARGPGGEASAVPPRLARPYPRDSKGRRVTRRPGARGLRPPRWCP